MVNPAVVGPEPSTMLLMAVGLAGVVAGVARRHSSGRSLSARVRC